MEYAGYIKRDDHKRVSIDGFAKFSAGDYTGWKKIPFAGRADKAEDVLPLVVRNVVRQLYERGYTDDDIDYWSTIHNKTAAVINLSVYNYDLQKTICFAVAVHA